MLIVYLPTELDEPVGLDTLVSVDVVDGLQVTGTSDCSKTSPVTNPLMLYVKLGSAAP